MVGSLIVRQVTKEILRMSDYNMLIVEDDKDTLELYSIGLRSIDGLHADFVTTCEDALAHLKSRKYDHVVSDLSIPAKAGDAPTAASGTNVLLEAQRKDILHRWVASSHKEAMEDLILRGIATYMVDKTGVVERITTYLHNRPCNEKIPNHCAVDPAVHVNTTPVLEAVRGVVMLDALKEHVMVKRAIGNRCRCNNDIMFLTELAILGDTPGFNKLSDSYKECIAYWRIYECIKRDELKLTPKGYAMVERWRLTDLPTVKWE